MSNGEAMVDASFACGPARCSGAREALLVAVILYGLAQSAEAFAGDPPTDVVKDIQPIIGGTPLSLAFVPGKSQSDELHFSADEFRPRKPGILAPPALGAESVGQAQVLPSTSVWQRLADYRSQGRVQLLTLWESKHSTVSLQAGKHGGPSLQWSSRLMNRGGASRGLLDRFVASSLGAAGFGPKAVAHAANSTAANKIITMLPAYKSP
jgi:uncharacterized membrane protein (UPF0136 family)